MKMQKAKRSLGQNFLINKSVVEKIIEVSNLENSDVVLEIGPGKGILTEKLLEKVGRVVAIEKDDRLYGFLKEKFKKEIKSNKLNLIHGDILDSCFHPNLDAGCPSGGENRYKYKIVANIPYNITGKILREFLGRENQPQTMTLLVQKEVAERIVAKNGKESILSISIKAYGEPKYIETVSAQNFLPAPKVDSAILLIKKISKNFFHPHLAVGPPSESPSGGGTDKKGEIDGMGEIDGIGKMDKKDEIDEKKFFKLLKQGFSQKRKKLSNTLKNIISPENSPVNLNLRAENLTLLDWRRLFLKI